ncbi:hypothetical protein G3H63_04790 [Microbacterium resistens]|uniref:MmcQ/YjbR family DNA-binding protein n=1 Tax=Microbacterium resistens TaxID=156977 RepID=UPI00082CD1E5|nr:MmcQ/YjbR family DNA-binding protein [Microbacterium resistens]MBW1638398.1 hypothetical protein [Microbacterium resistens]
MATLEDVRRIALALPQVTEKVDGHRGGATWRTAAGLVVWERPPSKRDLEQLGALGLDWPDDTVVGVRVDGPQAKAALLETYPDAFFTIPHFEGYPAVLIRLSVIDDALLRETITDAWLLRVPSAVGADWLAAQGLS